MAENEATSIYIPRSLKARLESLKDEYETYPALLDRLISFYENHHKRNAVKA